jgi:hypothetical protein
MGRNIMTKGKGETYHDQVKRGEISWLSVKGRNIMTKWKGEDISWLSVKGRNIMTKLKGENYHD